MHFEHHFVSVYMECVCMCVCLCVCLCVLVCVCVCDRFGEYFYFLTGIRDTSLWDDLLLSRGKFTLAFSGPAGGVRF